MISYEYFLKNVLKRTSPYIIREKITKSNSFIKINKNMLQIFKTFRQFQTHALLTRGLLSANFAISKPKNTLFDRLGGESTLARASDVFDTKVSLNPNLTTYFKDFSDKFKEHQRKTLRIAFGDPTGYTTRDIKSFHSVSHINEKDWDTYISLLKETLSQLVSNPQDVAEAVALVDKYRKSVVEKTIFEKLNKNGELVREIVSTLFDKILTDPETRDFFLTFNVSKIKIHVTDFMVNLIGGSNPKSYKDIRIAHRPMDLHDRHFYIFKKHLNDALRFHGIESEIIDEVLFLVETHRNDILDRKTPYEVVGKEFGVSKIIDRMYEMVPEQPLLKRFFEEVDIEKVKNGQSKFFSAILGGPKYVGKDMKSIHGKMNLADSHFDAFKLCFENTLKEMHLKPEDIRDCTYQLEKYRRVVCSISLFELLGGEPHVLRIVKTMAMKMRNNDVLKGFYENADDDEMKAVLRAELMHALGGPLSFRERDLKAAHKGLFITKEHFREYKHLLFESMKENGVVDNLIVQVLRIFENKAFLVISKETKEDLKKQAVI